MRFACNHCHARYDLPSEKLTGGAVRVRCSRCRGLFVVRRRLPEAVGPPTPIPRLLVEPDDLRLDLSLLFDSGCGLAEGGKPAALSPADLPFLFDPDLSSWSPKEEPPPAPRQSFDSLGSRTETAQAGPPSESGSPVVVHLRTAPPADAVPSLGGLRPEAPSGHAGAAPCARAHSQIVSEPVRSGQRVYAGDADLVVLGAVSSGAEVVADGDVHVYGVLRGRAVAGARGDAGARIFCLGLEAERVSVAGTSLVMEPVSEELQGRPAQIYVRDDELVIEPIGPAPFASAPPRTDPLPVPRPSVRHPSRRFVPFLVSDPPSR
ncbi:MAG: septum site-determining protein MinC [Deltaproteobacteria bacterium]|nr:septum site-determining protein MinC [Deltaproteobacteria bacterium]